MVLPSIENENWISIYLCQDLTKYMKYDEFPRIGSWDAAVYENHKGHSIALLPAIWYTPNLNRIYLYRGLR